jgi:hypothetical protein
MKTLPLNHGLTLEALLSEASHETVALVDELGHNRFLVLRPEAVLDDPAGEVEALRSNPRFMEDLDRWQGQVGSGGVKSIDRVRTEYEALEHVAAILGSLSAEDAERIISRLGIDPGRHGVRSAKELLDHWGRCVEGITGD